MKMIRADVMSIEEQQQTSDRPLFSQSDVSSPLPQWTDTLTSEGIGYAMGTTARYEYFPSLSLRSRPRQSAFSRSAYWVS